MKQVLLLVAIYSLIFHQSQKQTEQKMVPVAKKTITKIAASNQVQRPQIALLNIGIEYTGFTGIMNKNANIDWIENE